MVPIKAVFFDYFGVISSDRYWQLVKEDKNMHGNFSRLSADVNSGKISWANFADRLAEITGQDIAAINRLFKSERIDPEVLAHAHALHASYKTGLVTNAHHEFFDQLVATAHLDSIFDVITISSRVGAAKPSPEIFITACKQAGVEPEEVVFIDDIARNCDGAVKLGMRAIIYQDLPRLKLDLAKLGIAPAIE